MKHSIICLLTGLLLSFSAFAEDAATKEVASKDVSWPTVQNLKEKDPNAANVYDRPYSLTENKVDTKLLLQNTGGLVGLSVVTMGLLYIAPSSFTNWDDEDRKHPLSKWWDNVSRAPVWDKDDFFLNYVTHPYAGAVYYMGARSAGANAGYSFLYSFALSTFFWECGIEALAERPSIQDLIVTPVFGAIFGEGFYQAKRHILDNDRELLGSRILGQTTIFLMDPLTEMSEFFFADKPEEKQKFSFSSQPFVSKNNSFGYGLRMTYHF